MPKATGCRVHDCGQGVGKKVQDVLFSTISQRAIRAPDGVARHTIVPTVKSAPCARHVHGRGVWIGTTDRGGPTGRATGALDGVASGSAVAGVTATPLKAPIRLTTAQKRLGESKPIRSRSARNFVTSQPQAGARRLIRAPEPSAAPLANRARGCFARLHSCLSAKLGVGINRDRAPSPARG